MQAPRMLVVTALALLAGGCATTRLPNPEPGLLRTPVQRRVTTCRGENCTFDLRVGSTRYRVRSEARTVTPEEATGGTRPTLARRAAGSVAGSLLRRIGLSTSSRAVLLDTRLVADSASALAMRCSLVSVMEIEKERVGDDDEETATELAHGADCIVTTAGDSAPRWRFRSGIAPVPDSIAATLEAIGPGTGRLRTRDPVLIRHLPAPPDSLQYSVGDTMPGRWTPEVRTVIRRPDGTLLGSIVRMAGDPVAIDAAPGTAGEEAGLLRLLAVVFVRR